MASRWLAIVNWVGKVVDLTTSAKDKVDAEELVVLIERCWQHRAEIDDLTPTRSLQSVGVDVDWSRSEEDQEN